MVDEIRRESSKMPSAGLNTVDKSDRIIFQERRQYEATGAISALPKWPEFFTQQT